MTNLKRMRQFYVLFPKGAAAWHLLSWSHFASQYRLVLPTEEELRREIERERDLAVREQEERYGGIGRENRASLEAAK